MIGIVKQEQQTLNCIFDDAELIYRFDENYYVSAVAHDLFEVLKELYESKLPFTTDHLVAQGYERNNYITRETIEKLRNVEYDLEHFETYFSNLRKLYAKNRIENHLLKETLVETSKKGELNVEKIEALNTEIQRNLDIVEGKRSRLYTASELATAYEGELQLRMRGESVYSSGDSHLDKYLVNGFPPGQITLMFGATGVGKSALALNIINKQINKRIPSVYLSLEMDRIATMDRLVALRMNIPQHFFYPEPGEDKLDGEIVSSYKQEKDRLSKAEKFLFAEDPNLSIRKDVKAIIQEAKRRMGVNYLVVFVDLISMLSDMGENAQEIENSMNALNALAKKENVHLVGVVQANRSTDTANVPTPEYIERLRPKLHNIKNSHAFSERARMVLGVFRPKYYADRLFPEEPEVEVMDDVMEVQLLKSSQGRMGNIIKYLYHAEKFRLTPVIESSEE